MKEKELSDTSAAKGSIEIKMFIAAITIEIKLTKYSSPDKASLCRLVWFKAILAAENRKFTVMISNKL